MNRHKQTIQVLEGWFPGAPIEPDEDGQLRAAYAPGHRAGVLWFQDRPASMLEEHQRADGTWCGGFIDLEEGIHGRTGAWTVQVASPLTLSPSLNCTRCPSHGWIRHGTWVEA